MAGLTKLGMTADIVRFVSIPHLKKAGLTNLSETADIPRCVSVPHLKIGYTSKTALKTNLKFYISLRNII